MPDSSPVQHRGWPWILAACALAICACALGSLVGTSAARSSDDRVHVAAFGDAVLVPDTVEPVTLPTLPVSTPLTLSPTPPPTTVVVTTPAPTTTTSTTTVKVKGKAVAAAVVTTPSTRPRTGFSAPVDHSAYLVGDSLSEGTETDLPPLLQADGVALEQIELKSQPTDWGLARLQERVMAGPLPGIVVFALGTNDAKDPNRFRAQVKRVEAIVGTGRCLVVPTIQRDGWESLNTALVAEANAHNNVVVADWHTLVQQHPDYLGSDRVHATPAGYQARAEQLRDAVLTCLGRPTP